MRARFEFPFDTQLGSNVNPETTTLKRFFELTNLMLLPAVDLRTVPAEGPLDFIENDRGVFEFAALVETVYRHWPDRFKRPGAFDPIHLQIEIRFWRGSAFLKSAQRGGSITVKPENAETVSSDATYQFDLIWARYKAPGNYWFLPSR